ncbi:PfkB family carbohydrate kinase [Clostridium boliviensis]|jgi:sugar/nucleoside kinase (ribokinase family)|uniref:PfkB family carbohydrate kinase n=1 Tax=Clostridium boliviensis TaxID=318465 RepID=A0ABU4GEV8_9CLOT|nr:MULTISPECIES: PfkB family carbohydrate kinase [Clostridia]MDW2796158.1 PfkB family carbohydrate kinase [Clostridium boliviensis]
MAKYNTKVLGFGDNVVDLYEHSHMMYPGGNCVNLCAYSKIFGAERVAYMGYFGSDDIAEFVISVLNEMEIETVKCKQLVGENGWSKCTLIDGERTFGDYNEGGVRGKNPYILDRFDLEYMKQFDFVHTGNYCYTESQLKVMKEAGIKVSFDFSDESTNEYYEKYAPFITYAFCSFDGDDDAAKEHLKFIHSLGPEIAYLTRGPKGCILYDGEQFYVQPATMIESVVDTMGAGDSFLTAFMNSYIDQQKKGNKKQAAITLALAEASKFAAHVCTLNGAFGYGKPYED